MDNTIHKSCVAVLLAAGKGQRFGRQKQFLEFCGVPLWKYVYNKLLNYIIPANIVVVGVDIQGSSTRSGSVIEGLNYFKKQYNAIDRVIIVEAARPLVTLEQLKTLIFDDHDSATFVMPSVNTIIMKDYRYIKRSECLDLLTPQAFNYKKLVDAYSAKNEWDLTDETVLMNECYHILPHFIEGGKNLYKITYPEDIAIIQAISNFMEKV